MYICLFTCASTRAIHLELTPSLSVESFLRAFRRFTSRRGVPVTLMSDNATTFKSASKDIRKITRSEEVLRYLTDNRITRNFIVEKGPWWGGGGGLLGANGQRREATLEENSGTLDTRLWRATNRSGGDRSSSERQSVNVCLG